MARHSVPIWKMLIQAVEELSRLNGTNSIQYVRDHYSQDNVKPEAVRLQLISSSVNHPSARHFPDPNRFLWYEGNGYYRAYDPKTDKAELAPGWRIIPVTPQSVEKPSDALVPHSKLEPGNRIALPSVVMQSLDLGPSDVVAFVPQGGKYFLRKGHLKIEIE